jgi:dipeptidyl aminopeptidase/acylaminoacyl peptidase
VDVDAAAFNVERLLELPRLSGLAISADGRRLVTSVATVAPDGKRYRSSLWELDPAGVAAPRQLTRSERGDTLAAFLPDGSLLFTSDRPDTDAKPREGDPTDQPAALWLLPAGGGEAFVVASPPGGIDAVAVAERSGTVACYVPTFPRATDWDDDQRRGDERREKEIGARLFETYPIRWWDRYLGPRRRRIAVGTLSAGGGQARLNLCDLTPDAGEDLEECDLAITPDGGTVITTWRGRNWYAHLVAIDVASGQRRVLFARDDVHIGGPACSPDGRMVACVGERAGTPQSPVRATVWLVDLATGESRDLLPDSQLWPTGVAWTGDSTAVLVSADEAGRVPIWRVEAIGTCAGTSTRLSADGALSDVHAAADGRLVALRSTNTQPPHGVVLDDMASNQEPQLMRSPGTPLALPTPVEELWLDAPDGRGRVQCYLTLPADASAQAPAPLVLMIHGGPFASFNAWHWRWNSHVFAARGYAVLEVNPALSTGFGWENIDRGWGLWGAGVEPDLLAAVDTTCARPDIDGDRVAAAGGSFGGYMANWLAGHSKRFRCIVTHAALWSMEQFHGTTDIGTWVENEFGDPYVDASSWIRNSPRTSLAALAAIRTPMLVIHGERDVRVPISEALQLWTDLRHHDVPARFLYFPDENHWVLKPHNSRIWYATVLAFLDEHLLGKPFERPELL